MTLVKHISEAQHKSDAPGIRVGSIVKVHQKIREGEKERVQIFEGLVIAAKGGKGVNATFTVRKIASGVGVERIYPIHSPNVVKVEIVREHDVKRAKLYYVRHRQDNAPRARKPKTHKKTAKVTA